MFDNRYLLRPTTFLKDLSQTFDFFKGKPIYFTILIANIHPLICFCHIKNSSHFLKGTIFILLGDFAIFHCLNNSFSSNLICKNVGSGYAFFYQYYNYFSKILTVMHFFNSTVHFPDIKICSHSIFSMEILVVKIISLLKSLQDSNIVSSCSIRL